VAKYDSTTGTDILSTTGAYTSQTLPTSGKAQIAADD
jgi:hypothetical protein